MSRRMKGQLIIAGVALAIFFSMIASLYTLTNTTDQVEENSDQLKQIKRVFRADKVCSLSNQGQACIDLFDRLARNITRKQRKELACVVLESINTADSRRTLHNAGCEEVLADAPMPP